MSHVKYILGLTKYYFNGFSTCTVQQHSALYCIDIVSSGFHLFGKFLKSCELLKYWTTFIYKAL